MDLLFPVATLCNETVPRNDIYLQNQSLSLTVSEFNNKFELKINFIIGLMVKTSIIVCLFLVLGKSAVAEAWGGFRKKGGRTHRTIINEQTADFLLWLLWQGKAKAK